MVNGEVPTVVNVSGDVIDTRGTVLRDGSSGKKSSSLIIPSPSRSGFSIAVTTTSYGRLSEVPSFTIS